MSEASTDSVGHLVKKMSPMEWVVLGSALLGVIVFLRYRKAQQAASAQNDQTALLDQLSGTGGLAGLLAGGNTPATAPTGAPASQAPMDNESWASQATAALLAHGGYTPLDINQAFANFLSGQPLTTLQQQIINQAEQLFGAPPLSVPNIQLAPPAPAPTPAPAQAPDWISRIGDIIGEIGRRIPTDTTPVTPAPAPAPAPPAPSGPLAVMDQGTYLGAFLPENIAVFTGAGGYLDKFFANPNQYQILNPNGTQATTTQVLADLRARGITIRPNWVATN